MPVSERVKNFIFEHIDSIEALEILLLFHANQSKSWSYATLASELRSNPNSAESRSQVLHALQIIREKPGVSGEFYYDPENRDYAAIVDELAQHYRIQRHKIFELIFSPLKKARDFAEAFKKSDPKEGKQDG